MKKASVVIAKQPEVDPEPVCVIASRIRAVSEGMKRIQASGLTRRGLCLLLADTPGLNCTECYNVLAALDRLGSKFIVKEENK